MTPRSIVTCWPEATETHDSVEPSEVAVFAGACVGSASRPSVVGMSTGLQGLELCRYSSRFVWVSPSGSALASWASGSRQESGCS